MSDPLKRVSAPSDPRGRLVSIFVGAVLLPSIALSVVSLQAVPKQAEHTKITLLKRAEKILHYVEEDLERMARERVIEAAKVLGPERLLEGRSEVVDAALEQAGMGENMFETLRLEASSPIAERALLKEKPEERLKEVFQDPFWQSDTQEEGSVKLTGGDSKMIGVLRFKYSCDYAHGSLLREYFEEEFSNPDNAMVIRVAEPSGHVVYETAPTPDDKFEVKRVMESPTFKGLKLYLRYKDRSIEQDVRRWAMAKMAMIGFIDLMLGAGLFLVYGNVKRELHLSRLKSDFVANVSHELKTPLALIRLFAETLELGRVQGEDKARQYYRVINKESQRLTQLINNILDFSRIEAGRKEYRFAPTDVNRAVQEVLEAYRFHIEQQGFELAVDLADDLPEVEVDKEALSQAVINLINNALKYSRDEKYIRVATRRPDGRILVSVTDRGIGIARSEHRKIFEKFYRAEDSLVHETKGSGLGLSLVWHIMEAHGGSVEVESAPGKGSTFTLVIPLRPTGGAAR
jgi:signal transduction histidine kinase